MSFILEALRKAEKERKEISSKVPFQITPPSPKKNLYRLFTVFFVIFLGMGFTILAFKKNLPSQPERRIEAREQIPVSPVLKEPELYNIEPKREEPSQRKEDKDKAKKPSPQRRKILKAFLTPERKENKEERKPLEKDTFSTKEEVVSVKRLDTEKINSLFNEATSLFERNDLEAAKKIYLAILAEKPDHLESLNNLGLIYMKEGRKNEAIQTFRKILNIKNDYPKAYTNLGIILLSEGEKKVAEEYFRKAFELGGEVGSLVNLLSLLIGERRYEEAERLVRPFIEKGIREPHLVLAYALIKDEKGELKEAVKFYRAFLREGGTKEERKRVLERIKYLEEISEGR